jgi:hypothetical protein
MKHDLEGCEAARKASAAGIFSLVAAVLGSQNH